MQVAHAFPWDNKEDCIKKYVLSASNERAAKLMTYACAQLYDKRQQCQTLLDRFRGEEPDSYAGLNDEDLINILYLEYAAKYDEITKDDFETIFEEEKLECEEQREENIKWAKCILNSKALKKSKTDYTAMMASKDCKK